MAFSIPQCFQILGIHQGREVSKTVPTIILAWNNFFSQGKLELTWTIVNFNANVVLLPIKDYFLEWAYNCCVLVIVYY